MEDLRSVTQIIAEDISWDPDDIARFRRLWEGLTLFPARRPRACTWCRTAPFIQGPCPHCGGR